MVKGRGESPVVQNSKRTRERGRGGVLVVMRHKATGVKGDYLMENTVGDGFQQSLRRQIL